jgi:hypothetical protein
LAAYSACTNLVFPNKFHPTPHDLRGKSNLPAKFILVFGGLAGRLAGRLEGGLVGGFGSGPLTAAVKLGSKLKNITLLLVFCSAKVLHNTTGCWIISIITIISHIKPECIGRSNHFAYSARRTNICPDI